MKRKVVSHKAGVQTKRPDLLRSEGIPSTEAVPTASPLSGSPKMSTGSSRSRYRSKPRHRRGNSRGSHSDFAAILKTQPAQENSPHPTYLQHTQAQCPSAYQHNLPQQQVPPPLPQSRHPRLNAHGQDIATCANNLRYFGPAAALRSPLKDRCLALVPTSSPQPWQQIAGEILNLTKTKSDPGAVVRLNPMIPVSSAGQNILGP